MKRNKERFPKDFMFQMGLVEWQEFTKRFEDRDKDGKTLRSQFAISKLQDAEITQEIEFRGGRRSPPFCFTEQGVAMLSAVLRSKRAIAVSIEIVRTFVKLRVMLSSNLELARRLAALEDRYDEQFKSVFDAIRDLMAEPKGTNRKICFEVKE